MEKFVYVFVVVKNVFDSIWIFLEKVIVIFCLGLSQYDWMIYKDFIVEVDLEGVAFNFFGIIVFIFIICQLDYI